MFFQALTAAPSLRAGAKLNFMAVPQEEGAAPARITAGDRVTVRFGNCCPLIREGRITAADAEAAVLSLDDTVWTLAPGETGVDVPGIVSRDWIIVRRDA